MKKVVGGNPAREGSPYERAFCRARRDSFRSLYVVGAVQSRPVSLASGVPPVRDRTGQFFPRVDFAAFGEFSAYFISEVPTVFLLSAELTEFFAVYTNINFKLRLVFQTTPPLAVGEGAISQGTEKDILFRYCRTRAFTVSYLLPFLMKQSIFMIDSFFSLERY